LRQRMWPGQEQRLVPLAIGKPEHTAGEFHGTSLVFDPEIPTTLAGRFGMPIGFAPFSPRRQGGKEHLDTGIRGIVTSFQKPSVLSHFMTLFPREWFAPVPTSDNPQAWHSLAPLSPA
jgi:hypothetical protein